jgi:hypothetical protein
MTIEKLKATDVVSSGLSCNTKSGEAAQATGMYYVECRDKDGNLKWEAQSKNLVVSVGLQYMAGTSLDGATARVTTWYLGLITGPGSGTTIIPANTMSSHAGWTEFIDYTSATRVAATFAAATTATPSVVTNSATPTTFTINGAGGTVAGAFLTSANDKSGTTGTLFSAADFGSPNDRVVVSGDTLVVTYTFSLAG